VTGEAPILDVWEGRPVEEWRSEWRLPRLLIYRRTVSTNDTARALAEAGAPPFTTIIAEEQSRGRGRFGRPWFAPHGSALLLTVLLPAPGAATAPGASLRLGVATARAIERTTGQSVSLKWPNDVLSPDGRKLAGILCESMVGPGGGALVAGIGINVNQTERDWPVELRTSATSLRQLTGDYVNRAALASALIAEIRAQAPRMASILDPATNDEFLRRDVLRGQPILLDGVPAGVARGIAADGALRLHGPHGEQHVWSGTVRIDRAANGRHLPADESLS
jgi:BirA family biotin operon repressor/biotin-[acetyl-CoA-carboxylase] ligase